MKVSGLFQASFAKLSVILRDDSAR